MEILGRVTSASQHEIDLLQRGAWEEEVVLLQRALRDLPGHVFLEFDVPRLGSRIDAVVVSGPAIFPIEFKVGATEFLRGDVDQAWDYALDLKNFHEASHRAPLFPILVATAAATGQTRWEAAAPDGVCPPRCCNADGVRAAIEDALSMTDGPPVDPDAWGHSRYRPTPTIIQAAQALYSQHSVDAITRSDAGAQNLAVTSRRIEEVVEQARLNGQKAILFVTGVPGAGKTLVGLDIATKRRDATSETHAVYLSGNGPLVAVLREALTKDEISRLKLRGQKRRKGEVGQKVKLFIQNVHHFRDDGLRDEGRPPVDHVVIFDEAQRAWDHKKTADFMARRRQRPGFMESEPEFLLSYMDRHHDWAVVICLVGGGQEIHTGEAGIAEWLTAVQRRFPAWQVWISPELTDSEYNATKAIAELGASQKVRLTSDLHLAVSMRSFRAESVSRFVKALLDLDAGMAEDLLRRSMARYPIVLTRDLRHAKRWIKARARGTERYGLVASSSAQRLKPHAIDVRVAVDPIHYFLSHPQDTRSSCYLEDAATEFQVQGLELDWVCVTWDADLRHTGEGWRYHSFRGDRWERVHKPDRRKYLLNAYRVLLTRSRQGMAVFIPPGDPEDPTRDPVFYDGTYEYFRSIGLPVLE